MKLTARQRSNVVRLPTERYVESWVITLGGGKKVLVAVTRDGDTFYTSNALASGTWYRDRKTYDDRYVARLDALGGWLRGDDEVVKIERVED